MAVVAVVVVVVVVKADAVEAQGKKQGLILNNHLPVLKTRRASLIKHSICTGCLLRF